MKTLKTLVLKTATVTGVKLVTPADRIGLGFGLAYPTDTLSPGQIPLPPNPEPEQARVRQELSDMRVRMHPFADGDAVPPAGRPGCSPGVSADRSASPSASSLTTSWRIATRTAAAGRADSDCLTADPGRDHFPRDRRHDDRTGSDCQSPGRSSDKRRPATRGVNPAASAGK